MTLATPHFGKILGVMSGLALGRFVSNLKYVALTVFDLLAFNAQKFRGSRDPATPLLEKFLGVMSGLSLGRLVSNLKYVALTVFDLLAFNAQKFRGSRDPATPLLEKFLGGHVRTVPGKTCVKFEVRSFNHFCAISV